MLCLHGNALCASLLPIKLGRRHIHKAFLFQKQHALMFGVFNAPFEIVTAQGVHSYG